MPPVRKREVQAAAHDTRERIFAAARDLLAAPEGFTSFSIEGVARQAGVARMTVYYQFRSRRELFEALFDHIAERAGFFVELPAIFHTPEPEAALRRFVRFFCGFWRSDPVVIRRLRGLASLDPDLGAALAGRDQRRRTGAATLIQRLSAAAPLALPDGEAAAVLHAATSFEAFDALAATLSPDRATDLIERMVFTALGVPAPTAPP